jgi:septum formation protein
MTPDIYLASSSPRRKELLSQLGVHFAVVHPHVDESRLVDESAEHYVVRLARDDLIGKPKNKSHFLQLMERLSGNVHKVYSAVAAVGNDVSKPLASERFEGSVKEKCLVSCTSVQFRDISVGEREWYWQSGEPLDKAGGYAIQGLAAAFVQSIHGSYSGVVGLPLFETAQLLNDFGINIFHDVRL